MTRLGSHPNKWVKLIYDRLFRLQTPFLTQNSDAVWVFGNPKSGTSVIAELLAIGGGWSATVDIPTLWRTPVSDVRKGLSSAQALVEHHQAYFSRDLIKEPGLTVIMDRLVEELELQKVVFVVRDPRTNIRSLLQRRGVPGNMETLTPELRLRLCKSNWHWTYDWPYRNERKEPHWLRDRQYIDGLAAQWQSGVDALECVREMGVEPLVIRYEDFLLDKESTITEALEKMGSSARVDFGPYMDVQFQPKGDHSMPLDVFFGEANLERIERATKKGVGLFNYS